MLRERSTIVATRLNSAINNEKDRVTVRLVRLHL
jgi:hypothetical protein